MPDDKSRFRKAQESVAESYGRSTSAAGDFKRGVAMIGALLTGAKTKAQKAIDDAAADAAAAKRRRKFEKGTQSSQVIDPLRQVRQKTE